MASEFSTIPRMRNHVGLSRDKPRLRRLAAYAFFLSGFISGSGLAILVALWTAFYFGGSMSDDRFYRLLALGFFVTALPVIYMVIFHLGLRRFAWLRGFDREEMSLLLKWAFRGDPLGTRHGKTLCHKCGYARKSKAICSECGAERIDPI